MKEGWEVKSLGDISNISYGYTAKSSSEKGTYKYLRITDIQNNCVLWDNVPFCNCNDEDSIKYELKEGDIVFVRTGATTGKSFLLRGDFPKSLFASYLIRLQLIDKELLLPDFLRYYFDTSEYWDIINIGIVGAAQGGFNATKLSQLRIPTPLLSEQQRIIEILDKAFAKIDTVKQNAERNLKNSKELFQSVLSFEMENKGKWSNYKLIDLYKFIDYRGTTPNKIEHGIPFITAKNVKLGYIDYTISEFISKEDYENRKSRGISKKGDILFTTEAPLGNVALADLDKFSAGQRLITFQQYPDKRLDNKFYLYYMMSHYFQNELELQKTGATVAGIKASRLKEILMPQPSLEEQTLLAEKLDALSTKCKELENNYLQAMNNCDELKKAILAKAFNGEL